MCSMNCSKRRTSTTLSVFMSTEGEEISLWGC